MDKEKNDISDKENSKTLIEKFKNGFAESEYRRPSPIVIGVIACAVAILLFMKGIEAPSVSDNADETAYDYMTEREYVSSMENDLKDILERIDGAGEVSVRIYIESTREKVLAENSKKQSETSGSENETRESVSSETEPVVPSSGGTPYVVSEKLPYPIGVVVVAEGAKDDVVKNEIYEAVKALYGLSANRIKITY